MDLGSFSDWLFSNPRRSSNVVDLTRDPFVNMLRQMQEPVGGWSKRPVHPHIDPFKGGMTTFGYGSGTLREAREPTPVAEWGMPYRSTSGWRMDEATGKLVEFFDPPATPATNIEFQNMMRQLIESYPPQSLSRRPQPAGFSIQLLKQAAK